MESGEKINCYYYGNDSLIYNQIMRQLDWNTYSLRKNINSSFDTNGKKPDVLILDRMPLANIKNHALSNPDAKIIYVSNGPCDVPESRIDGKRKFIFNSYLKYHDELSREIVSRIRELTFPKRKNVSHSKLPKTILSIDDNSSARAGISAIFESEGYHVMNASDSLINLETKQLIDYGENLVVIAKDRGEALEAATRFPFNVAIVDNMMAWQGRPDFGIDLAEKRLKSLCRYTVPIIYTGYPEMTKQAAAAIDKGDIFDYVIKTADDFERLYSSTEAACQLSHARINDMMNTGDPSVIVILGTSYSGKTDISIALTSIAPYSRFLASISDRELRTGSLQELEKDLRTKRIVTTDEMEEFRKEMLISSSSSCKDPLEGWSLLEQGYDVILPANSAKYAIPVVMEYGKYCKVVLLYLKGKELELRVLEGQTLRNPNENIASIVEKICNEQEGFKGNDGVIDYVMPNSAMNLVTGKPESILTSASNIELIMASMRRNRSWNF